MSDAAKVPGTVAWRYKGAGVLDAPWRLSENEPHVVGAYRIEKDALISRAETVAWLRAEADDPLCGGIPYIGWLRELADALERGEETG